VVDYIIAEISYQNIYKKQSITKDLIHFLKKNNFTRVKSTHVTKSKNKLFQADVLFKKVKK
jgi:N-acetylglutamate synthase-like GNAT family acetyltransferase